MLEVPNDIIIAELRHIWNDIIGAVCFATQVVVEKHTKFMTQEELIDYMLFLGCDHFTPRTRRFWDALPESERLKLLYKAFPHEEYAS